MKPVFASKTFWFNLIVTIVAVISLAAQMPELQPYTSWLLFAVGALNIVLRIYFTVEPITFQPPVDAPKATAGRRNGDPIV